MKKFVRKSSTIAIAIIIVFAGLCTVKAANEESVASVTLTARESEVTAGETFTVTLSAKCEEGINGIDTTYSYNSEILELESASVLDSTKWSSLGTDSSITVICNSTETIKSADIYVLTFKVKDNAKVGSKAEISTTSILLDSDAATDSEKTIGAQTVEVTVIEKTSTDQDKTNNNQDKTNTDQDKTESESNKSNSGSTTTTTKSSSEKNSSSSKLEKDASKLPYTGNSAKIIILAIGIIVVTGVIAYLKYKKYRKI